MSCVKVITEGYSKMPSFNKVSQFVVIVNDIKSWDIVVTKVAYYIKDFRKIIFFSFTLHSTYLPIDKLSDF